MMKEIDVLELRKIQLNILSRLHNFCIEHGINYSLSSGTLIGAVRHKGYIPWDDDIDTYILRPDYERLEKEFEDEYIKILSPNTDRDCIYAYAKMYDSRTILIENTSKNTQSIGVNIDLFIIDSVPDNIEERRSLFRKNKLLDKLLSVKLVTIRKGRSFKKNLTLFLGKIAICWIPIRWIIKQKRKVVGAFNPKAKDVCNVLAGSSIRSCLPMDIMHNFIDIDFEGRTFKCMKDFDLYLSRCYGDYMQLPPVEKRVSHHSFKAYWK